MRVPSQDIDIGGGGTRAPHRDRIRLAGATRLPIAGATPARELSRSGRGESAGSVCAGWQLARWWLSLSRKGVVSRAARWWLLLWRSRRAPATAPSFCDSSFSTVTPPPGSTPPSAGERQCGCLLDRSEPSEQAERELPPWRGARLNSGLARSAAHRGVLPRREDRRGWAGAVAHRRLSDWAVGIVRVLLSVIGATSVHWWAARIGLSRNRASCACRRFPA